MDSTTAGSVNEIPVETVRPLGAICNDVLNNHPKRPEWRARGIQCVRHVNSLKWRVRCLGQTNEDVPQEFHFDLFVTVKGARNEKYTARRVRRALDALDGFVRPRTS